MTRRTKSARGRLLLCGLESLTLLALLVFTGAFVACPFPEDRLDRHPAAVEIQDRHGRTLRFALPTEGVFCLPVPLCEVSPWVTEATIAAEDQRFRRHPGVDPLAIGRAAMDDLHALRIVSGASTITMQVARLIEPRPRTWRSKAIEAIRALQIESLLSKDEILEQYLNRAPYGGNLIGIETAARRYFGCRASDLSLGQAALLAGLPQSPTRLRPDRRLARALLRRRYVLDRMRALGMITESQHRRASVEEVALRTDPPPFEAPHFVDDVIRRRGVQVGAGHPDHACVDRAATREETQRPCGSHGRVVIRTSLDPSTQSLAEHALREGAATRRVNGVRHGAVVVFENETGAPLAMVGSPSYFAEEDDGQVNGALARRSPGSALKPFLYAAAIDAGRITPRSVLADVPLPLSDYDPHNYDGACLGPVTAEEALFRSLNLPAVRLLRELGTGRFVARLRAAGLDIPESSADRAGLALALGAVEVSLLDLTAAYAGLARGGKGPDFAPVRHRRESLCSPPSGIVRTTRGAATARQYSDCMCSPEAAWLVLRMLASGGERPEEARYVLKTGTSAGHRDAWAIGCSPRFTVGVWIGNASGAGAAGLSGHEAAEPVLRTVLDELTRNEPPADFRRPAGIIARRVCPVSGSPPGPDCPMTVEDLAIASVSTDLRCAIHRRIAVDAGTGEAICGKCAGDRLVSHRVCEVWPADISAWLSRPSRRATAVPLHVASCTGRNGGLAGRADATESLRIQSPPSASRFILLAGDGAAYQRVSLEAAAPSDSSEIWWFVDGQMVACGPACESASWRPTPGRHEVRCVDDRGRSATSRVEVEGHQ